jgi:hypothetical protein
VNRNDLIDKLASSVGIDKANEVVDHTATRLGLGAGELDRDGVLKLLEALAQEPGLVGTVARFMKVRVILSPAAK